MPPQTLKILKQAWVCGRRLDLAPLGEAKFPAKGKPRAERKSLKTPKKGDRKPRVLAKKHKPKKKK